MALEQILHIRFHALLRKALIYQTGNFVLLENNVSVEDLLLHPGVFRDCAHATKCTALLAVVQSKKRALAYGTIWGHAEGTHWSSSVTLYELQYNLARPDASENDIIDLFALLIIWEKTYSANMAKSIFVDAASHPEI